jgi:hypothetical protein
MKEFEVPGQLIQKHQAAGLAVVFAERNRLDPIIFRERIENREQHLILVLLLIGNLLNLILIDEPVRDGWINSPAA